MPYIKGKDSCMAKKTTLAAVTVMIMALGGRAAALPDLLNGADTMMDLFSPVFAGGGAFSTSPGGASAGAVNPAAGGEAQRIVFEAGYMAIPGLAGPGFGNAVNLGALFPTKYAVFGGSLNFLNSPFPDSPDVFFLRNAASSGTPPVRTSFSGNFSAAKELYPGMNFGAGLNAAFGDPGENWGLSADLGFRYKLGSPAFFENLTVGAALKGLGKSTIPSAFTPVFGVSAEIFSVDAAGDGADPLKITGYLDFSVPGFRNFTGKFALSLLLAELVYVNVSKGFNVLELSRGLPSLYPSVGVGLNIALKSGGARIIGGRLPSDGDLSVSAAFKPLYDGSAAVGAGIAWTVGVRDNKAPDIDVDYPETVWFSPNNDGRADYLEIPIRISDQRYVSGWTLEIRGESGGLVRTYRNKELRPETQGVRNFLSRLTAVKAGVEIPESLRWDGIFDSGELAADGRYRFVLTAVDDNGNTGKTAVYETVVDNTPPAVEIAGMSENERIFSPDGDGGKDTLSIGQSGSREDRWEAGIYTAAGNRVKSFELTDAEPGPVVWDGTDDAGAIVADGVYEYRIAATDRAQNAGSAVLGNIVVNTIQPVVSLQIADAYFSPNGDGKKDLLVFNTGVPVKESAVGWELRIMDDRNNVRRAVSGTDRPPPEQFDFNGRDDRGNPLGEGMYYGELTVRYRNGYAAFADSPAFTLDLTPPRSTAAVVYDAFSPNNDGNQDEMIFRQEGSAETLWVGEIRPSGDPDSARLLRTFRMTGAPDSRLAWDGHSDAGALAPDGEYAYRLSATDAAGNSGVSNTVVFTLSTADTPVLLSTDLRAFSPSGSRNSISLVPQLQVGEGVASWKADILDAGGNAVRTFEGTGAVPASLPWNGRTADGRVVPDGTYTAGIEIRYAMGNQPLAASRPFVVDTEAPRAEITVPFTVFSPNGDGRRDYLPINVSTEGSDDWELSLANAGGQVIKSWKWTGRAPALPWDGTDEAGNRAPDGVYTATLDSTDEAGNSFRKTIDNIALDARVPRAFLTASAQAVAPLPQAGENRSVRMGIILSIREGVESWRLELLSDSGGVIRTFPDAAAAAPPPETVAWNGLDANGIVREGRFTPVLTLAYTKGDVVTVQTAPITVDVSGPELGFRSSPEYFSPDNDGVDDDLFLYLTARDVSPLGNWSLEIWEAAIDSQGRETSRNSFYRIDGRGPPAERLVWDGRSSRGETVQAATDYPFTFKAEDALGNSSSLEGRIGVDVLLVRDGDHLKIAVPSIIFRANAADFNGLSASIVDNNNRILRRVAEILNKFRDYRITVEGHANPTTPPGTAARRSEETGSARVIGLQPLSEDRARATVDFLVGFGVSRNRLSGVGRGGTRTVADFADYDNWWKNRRVEFILIK
jgi:outer membrane protein OmpA-like peptidoglycan-associated protein/flagellar hook assembly protein FlgD